MQNKPATAQMKLLIGVKLMNGGNTVLTLSYDLVSGNIDLVPFPLGLWSVVSDLYLTDLFCRKEFDARPRLKTAMTARQPHVYVDRTDSAKRRLVGSLGLRTIEPS